MGGGAERDRSRRWGIILAGGEGKRLRPLTRAITRDDRPKQFCSILGEETLLDRTRCRVALALPADRTVLVVTEAHHRFYAPLLAEVPPRCVVIQPENCGTAPAILYALLRVAAAGLMDLVAVFPSDHYVADDRAFMAHIDAAFEAADARPELLILLGITPDSPEVGYGWIEPGDPIPVRCRRPIHRVRGFWEKPTREVAQSLLERGCLWNSFVMVARVTALLALVRRASPELYGALAAVRRTLGGDREADAVRELYARLPSLSFSREVLAARPANLAVLPVSGSGWCDLGEPRRVLATLARIGRAPVPRAPAVVRSA